LRRLATAAVIETSTVPPTYPFSNSVIFSGEDRPKISRDSYGRAILGMGIREYANSRLIEAHRPAPLLHRQLFSRRSKDCVFPGSVLQVTSFTTSSRTAFSRFAGVLIAIKRRGTTIAFVLRNFVNKTGVEMRYNLSSPMIKKISVLARASKYRGLKRNQTVIPRGRRAKLYHLRDKPEEMARISSLAQRMIQAERGSSTKSGGSAKRDSIFG